jgi:hypothetical protein
MTTALAIPDQWKHDVQQFESRKFNVLAPRELGTIPPYHTPQLSVVNINPNPDAGDCYKLPGGKFGLSKVALDRISQAASITWLPELCGRVDDGRDPNIVRYKAVGRIKDLSGAWRTIIGEKEVDLVAIEDELRDTLPKRDKCPQQEPARSKWIEDTVTKEMIQFRKHKLARAQSGAMNRAIRSALALRSQYSAEEIARPFVLPRVQFTPDYSDPEVKKFMLCEATGHLSELYGAPAVSATLPPALPPAPEEDVVDAQAGPTNGDSAPAADPSPNPDPEPDDEEMRFQSAYEAEAAAGTPEAKAEALRIQLEVLGRLMVRKQYDPRNLKKAQTQFSREERKGFATHLMKMPDREPEQAGLPWDK